MPLTPQSRVYEEKLARSRKKREARNAFAMNRNRKAQEKRAEFSEPAPKNPLRRVNMPGNVEGSMIDDSWKQFKDAFKNPISTLKGAGKLALLSTQPSTAVSLLGPKESLKALTGMGDTDTQRAMAIGSVFSGPEGQVSKAGARFFTSNADEVIDVAKGLSDDLTRQAAFTQTRIEKLREQLAKARKTFNVNAEQMTALGRVPRETASAGRASVYRIGQEAIDQLTTNIGELTSRGGRAATRITQADIPVEIGALQRVLAVGRGARLDLPNSNPEDMILQVGGVSPSTATSAANKMFTSGAKTGEAIARTIFPDFVGTFKATPMDEAVTTGLLDLYTEARGGIRPVAGTAYNSAGEDIIAASRELYNANDHAIAKATEAAKQAVEQRIARAVGIELPEEFLKVRQAQLDFVNDPNENNVIVDFIANAGKGGVSLPNLTAFLQKRLQSGKLRPHQRAAYEQLLADAFSGKYKEINTKFNALSNQVDNPLSDILDDRFLNQMSDYVDSMRRKIRDRNFPDYTDAVFERDMQHMGDVIEGAAQAAVASGKKLYYRDIKKLLRT